MYKFLAMMLLLSYFLLACSAPKTAAPEKEIKPLPVSQASTILPNWETEWQKSLKESVKEGKVVIYSALGPPTRNALSEGFKKRFGLEVEWTPGSGSDISQKLLTERRAGLFLVDLFAVGSSNPMMELKPAGALDPLEPELLLPEVTDSNKWLDNRLPWVDKGHYIIAPAQTPASTLLINTEKVKSSEITSYMDLLQPRWKGKMAMLNPTRPGSSAKWLSVAGLKIMGWDFVKELAKQEINIAADKRIAVEWTTKGKTDLTIAPAGEIIDEFIKAGASIKIVHPKEGTYQSGGSSVISLINRRPHANAARLFVNWYLSREGQQIFADFDMRQGNRLDISYEHLPSEKIRQPGKTYVTVETEDFLKQEAEAINTIREIFSTYFK